MARRLRLVVGSSSAVGLVLALSAGACSSTPEIDESTAHESLALSGDGGDASADAGVCRDVVLRTRRVRHAQRGEDGRGNTRSAENDHEDVELSPPMAFALPKTIALTSPSTRAGVFVELSFQRPGAHEEIVCLYASSVGRGAGATAAEATLLFCSDGTQGDQVVTAAEVALGVVAGAQTTATVMLHEVAPCQRADGGATDAATPTDSSVPDAAIDSGSTCTPATCLPTGARMSAICTASGCQQSPLALGTACNDGSLCTTGDVCDGAGRCSGAAVVVPPPTPCLTTTCDPILGVVATPALDGTACAVDACTVGTVRRRRLRGRDASRLQLGQRLHGRYLRSRAGRLHTHAPPRERSELF